MRTVLTAVGWVLTRGLLLWLLYGPEAWVHGDVSYFRVSLGRVRVDGLAHTLTEYPLPAVAVLAVPWVLARALGAVGHFGDLMMLGALLTDAVFAVLLHVFAGSRRTHATEMWVLAVPLLGATAYARFDLLPGVLVGATVLLLAAHPRFAAAAAAVATGVKLWPALVLPALLSGVRRPRAVATVVIGIGVVLAGATVLVAGWARLVSPLSYQADRGLQIESLAATPAVLGWWLEPGGWRISYGASRAYEITGPGVGVLLVLTSVLTALLVAGLLSSWWWAWRLRGRLSGATVVWLVLSAVTGFIATGKVLSPQYMLWLLPAAAAGLAVAADDRRLVRWCALLLVTTGVTQLVFPGFYAGLTHRAEGQVTPAVLLLVLRNLLVVCLLAGAWVATYLSLAADRRSAADR
jgi:hypothetical protein